MRRMREQFWQVVLFALSIGILAIGIGFYVKKRHILFEANHSEKKLNRDVASRNQNKLPSESADEEGAPNTYLESGKVKNSEGGKEPPKFSADLSSEHITNYSNKNDNICKSVEYQGDGFKNTQISREDWTQVVTQFHEAKKLLKNWLTHSHKKFSESTIALMESQVEGLKIVQPPSIEEPDLSWRGIGIWTRDEKNHSCIRVSGGFVKWAAHEPKRTLFEMTRLVAQSWAPCELQKVDGGAAWEPLLKCLDVNEEQGCAAGSYSEAGWAVSTSLAYSLAAPGCKLPAFSKAKKNQCLALIELNHSAKMKEKAGVKSEAKEAGHE